MKIQRYQWEDAVTEAKTVGILTPGEASLALALAHAINWEPKDGGESELRWANELAAEVVGLSRPTYYRNIKGLKESGYMTEGYNLRPAIPESHNETREEFEKRRQALVDAYNAAKSQNETEKKAESLKMRLAKSQNETGESQLDNPYTVDKYTVENTLYTNTTAPASPVPCDTFSNYEVKEGVEDETTTSNSNLQAAPTNLELVESPESHYETDNEKDSDVYLTPGEEQAWAGIVKMYPTATPEQVTEAKEICVSNRKGTIYERATHAFRFVGVESEW